MAKDEKYSWFVLQYCKIQLYIIHNSVTRCLLKCGIFQKCLLEYWIFLSYVNLSISFLNVSLPNYTSWFSLMIEKTHKKIQDFIYNSFWHIHVKTLPQICENKNWKWVEETWKKRIYLKKAFAEKSKNSTAVVIHYLTLDHYICMQIGDEDQCWFEMEWPSNFVNFLHLIKS